MDAAALVERYLEHVRVEKRLAARTVEDLGRVRGIGAATLARLRPLVAVR